VGLASSSVKRRSIRQSRGWCKVCPEMQISLQFPLQSCRAGSPFWPQNRLRQKIDFASPLNQFAGFKAWIENISLPIFRSV
jgi:hypothetical protein